MNKRLEKIQVGFLAATCAGIIATTGFGIASQIKDAKAEETYASVGRQITVADQVRLRNDAKELEQDKHNLEIAAGLALIASTATGFGYLGARLKEEYDNVCEIREWEENVNAVSHTEPIVKDSTKLEKIFNVSNSDNNTNGQPVTKEELDNIFDDKENNSASDKDRVKRNREHIKEFLERGE